ncbi:DMT family transporter [Candidatus Saccharibacteria bacterium]|nr:DMT family transporter [Candidatus Saccharibacteria bacterium]
MSKHRFPFSKKKLHPTSYGMLVSSGVFWGLSPFLYKSGFAYVSVGMFLLGKFAVGALVIYLAGRHRFIKLKPSLIVALSIFGVLDGLGATFIYLSGVQLTSVLNTALIGLLMPFAVYFWANIVLKDAVSKIVIIGAVIATIGLGLTVVGSDASGRAILGDILILAYVLFNAALVVAGKYFLSKKAPKLPPDQLSFIEYFVSMIAVFVLFGIGVFNFEGIANVPTILYMLCAGTVLGSFPMLLYARSVKKLPSERLADLPFITAIIGISLGAIAIGGAPETTSLVGMALIAIGLLIGNSKINLVYVAHIIQHDTEKAVRLLKARQWSHASRFR